jgi:anti-sigma factor RsiW
MKQTQGSEDLIERYLLGELSSAERAALESEYLVDRAKYDQICRIEDDLLDRYAQGALSPADCERVERQYLTNPWRRRHMEFAKTLARVIDGEPAASSAAKPTTNISWKSQLVALPRGLRGALALIPAIAALLIVFGGTWFAIETSRLRVRLGEAQREVETQRRRAQTQARQIADLEAQQRQLTEAHERLQAQLQAVKKTESPFSHITPAPVFLTLSVEDFRSPGAQNPRTLVIPRGVAEARLRLYLPENAFPAYQVTLLAEDGSEVFSKNGLRPRAGKAGDFVIVNLPASKIANGYNVLALSGVSPTGAAEPLGKSMIKVRRR